MSLLLDRPPYILERGKSGTFQIEILNKPTKLGACFRMPMLWPRRNYLQAYAEMSLVNVSRVAGNGNGKNVWVVRVMTYGYCLG